jgi:hypothetical protein
MGWRSRRSFKAGDVIWSDAQTHIGENIGESTTHVLMIEMKEMLGRQARSC